MPLSEFHQATTTKAKLESAQSKKANYTSDVSSFMPDNEFVELLWENGQIVMQGQSNRPKKTSYPTPLSSHSLRAQGKDGRDPAVQNFGQFEAFDSSTENELAPAVPCANTGLNAHDDDMTPWINYPMEDPLCSELFSELAGISPAPPSAERNSGFGAKDFHNVDNGHGSRAPREDSEAGRVRTSHLFQPSARQQSQSSISAKSRLTGYGFGSSSSAGHQVQFQKQDFVPASKPLAAGIGVGLMNFSHFSRPASFARANESLHRPNTNEKMASVSASTNPVDSTLIDSTGLNKVEMRSAVQMRGDVASVEQRSEAICREDTSKNNHQNSSVLLNNNSTLPDHQINHQSSSFAASVAAGRQEVEKGPEAVVASSVCSGNSGGGASNDPKPRTKRKNQEGEESGYHSEDLDDESMKKPSSSRGGTTMKRSRAAEVHNLSERRRRDRINEKMRALQELIPNCNKVDKASMLDEAIEYLKTLQLQVQMMSMGSGLCMPPMMLPQGMQHMRTAPMAHFSPIGMGLGMGMGLNYGMGLLDMNGSPLIPVPSMHTSSFPCSSIPGTNGFPGMPGSTGLQLFGIPGHGQGLPMSLARAPLFSPMPGPAPRGNLASEVPGTMGNPLPVSNVGPSHRCKDQVQQQQCVNLEAAQKTSRESQVAKDLEQANLVQMGNHLLQASGNAAGSSANDAGNVPNS